ncbi:MAG: HD domain-containing protein [Acidobacteriota bacterium]|nr:HD domain-containing protein [Acidobacteriota bacterium]
MDRFESALRLAYRVHRGQIRKGTGIPYIAHILGVAAIALEHGANEDEAIGALLHDAAEDGGGEAMLAEIRAQFGDAAGDIVLGCSDSLVEDPAEKRPWIERKEAYVAHLAGAGASVCLVSAADKLHNVRAIARDYRRHGEAVWTRFAGGREGTLWYYEAVSQALWRRWPSELTDELCRAVEGLIATAGGN